jgi:5'-nucleotidase
VKQTVDAALAHAAEVGNQPVASITQDITTAFSGGSRDDRASESTLGDLVADALVDKLKAPETGGAEIGVVNPGGLRADLLYAKSGAETEDGVVTYAEANAVLPFVNNLWTTSLTGAQFKTVLEQQWQTNADGTVPSRPYLQLGLSKNVTYTYDASRAAGDRITSISVNGAPIDPAASYRIGTFSFLALGGDNFREFANGTDTRDSGLIDRDAWIDYLGDHSPVTPDFARQAVAVTGIPTAPVTGGSTVTLSLSKLDLTSLGSPANTELSATFEGSTAAAQTAPVTAGAASLSVTVPTDVSGAATLVIVAKPSGTTVRIPIEIEKSEPLKQLRTTPVVIVGLPIAGLPLVAVRGSWGPAPVHVTYQWSRDGVDIAGATGAVYRTTRSDRGHTITVTVTGTKDGYETATRTDSIRLLKF